MSERKEKLREAMASIFEEYGDEFVKLVVSQLRHPEIGLPSKRWSLIDVKEACERFLIRQGHQDIVGNVLFYLEFAHAIGKGRNPSELYAEIMGLEKFD